MTRFRVELRRPPDLPAAPHPPSASDHDLAVYALPQLPGGEGVIRGAAETGPEQVRPVTRTVLEHLARERRAAGHHDG